MADSSSALSKTMGIYRFDRRADIEGNAALLTLYEGRATLLVPRSRGGYQFETGMAGRLPLGVAL